MGMHLTYDTGIRGLADVREYRGDEQHRVPSLDSHA